MTRERFTERNGTPARQTLQLRRQEIQRAHIGRLFLHPQKFARVCVLREGRFQFSFRQREKLFQKNDGRLCIVAALALTPQFMADFSAANNDPLGVGNFRILDHGLKFSVG